MIRIQSKVKQWDSDQSVVHLQYCE